MGQCCAYKSALVKFLLLAPKHKQGEGCWRGVCRLGGERRRRSIELVRDETKIILEIGL